MNILFKRLLFVLASLCLQYIGNDLSAQESQLVTVDIVVTPTHGNKVGIGRYEFSQIGISAGGQTTEYFRQDKVSNQPYRATIRYCIDQDHSLGINLFNVQRPSGRAIKRTRNLIINSNVSNEGFQPSLSQEGILFWEGKLNRRIWGKVEYSLRYSCPTIEVNESNMICAKKINEDVSDLDQYVSNRIVKFHNFYDYTDIKWYIKLEDEYIQLFPKSGSYFADGVLDFDNLREDQEAMINDLPHDIVHEFLVTGVTVVTPGLPDCTIEKEFAVTFLNTPDAFSSIKALDETVQHVICPGVQLTLTAPSGTDYTYLWSEGANNLSCSQTYVFNRFGNYNLTVEDEQCTVNQIFDISANSLPAIEMEVVDNGNLCISELEGVTLAVKNYGDFDDFEWSSDENNTTYTKEFSMPGFYTLTAKRNDPDYLNCISKYDILIEACDNIPWDANKVETEVAYLGTANGIPAVNKLPLLNSASQKFAKVRYYPDVISEKNFEAVVRLVAQDNQLLNAGNLGNDWEYKVNYSIYDEDEEVEITSPDGEWITIKKDQSINILEGINRYALEEGNSKRLTLTVNQVICSENGDNYIIPPYDIYLFLELRFNFRNEIASNSAVSGVGLSHLSPPGKSLINWVPNLAAKEYEIQMAWKDEYTTHTSNYENDNRLLNQEGWFYTVNKPETEIDMTFPKGTLYFRIRPVGNYELQSIDQKPERKYGRWSAVFDMEIEGDGFEDNRHWSKSITYAEEGKKKEVIAYFDNLLRSEQVQTNLNTEGITLVAESLYDSEGRAVANILPVPLQKNHLRYESNLNRSALNSNEKYAKADFERGEPLPLSSSTGAAQYYSAANPFYTGSRYFPNIHLIPDATLPDPNSVYSDDVAYVQTVAQFERDRTGRPSITGGVGNDFRVGPRGTADFPFIHPTRHFYVEPTPTELKRLFGPSVWDASQYTKEVIIDPNDQISYTYKDKADKVIATALAGEHPDNLLKLDNYDDFGIYHLLDDKINKSEKLIENEFSHSFFNEMGKTYQFEYALNGIVNKVDGIENEWFSILQHCKTCVYNFEFYIINPDGELIDITNATQHAYYIDDLSLGSVSVGLNAYSNKTQLPSCNSTTTTNCVENNKTIRYQFRNDSYENLECDDPFQSDFKGGIIFETFLPDIGNYRLVRKLVLDPGDINLYKEALERNVDISSFEDNLIEPTDCIVEHLCECDKCEADCYYSLLDFRESTRIEGVPFYNDDDFSLCEVGTWRPEEIIFFNNCKAASCLSGYDNAYFEGVVENECEFYYDMLSKDVSPDGFWFEHEDFITSTATRDIIRISVGDDNWNDAYFDIFRSSKEALRNAWKDEYAEFLILAHPEYCHYDISCNNDNYISSRAYDYKMGLLKNWTEASTSGFINVNNDPLTNVFDGDHRNLWIRAINQNHPMYDMNGNVVNTGMSLSNIVSRFDLSPLNAEANQIISRLRSVYFLDPDDYAEEPQEIRNKVTAENDIRKWHLFYLFYQREKMFRWDDYKIQRGCTFFVAENANAINERLAPAGYTPKYRRTSKVMEDIGSEEKNNIAFEMLCEGQAVGVIQMILSECNYDLAKIVGVPENDNYNDEDFIERCQDMFAGTINSLTKYCKEAIGIENPYGFLTPTILDEYLNQHVEDNPTTHAHLYSHIEAVLNSIENDVTSSGYTGTFDLAGCLKEALHKSPDYCEESDVPSFVEECDTEEERFLPDLVSPTSVLECKTQCVEYMVNAIFSNKSKNFTIPSTVKHCDGFERVTVEGKVIDFYLLKLIEMNSFTAYRTQSSNNESCDNCQVTFFFVDASGNKINNITNVVFYENIEDDNPLSRDLPEDPDIIYPKFTHLKYKVDYRDGLNTVRNEDAYLYGIGFNLEGPCDLNTAGCTTKVIPVNICYGISEPPQIPSCADAIVQELNYINRQLLERRLEETNLHIINEHVNQCLQYDEQLRYSTSALEYHYTLYYYDRAGSLVQTVPPAGVKPLSIAQANSLTPPDPSHDLRTYYKYNSRGQVVWQKTPDAGESRFWYNLKGQLVLSQNAQQAFDERYSFTQYDELGRMTSVGLIYNGDALIESSLDEYVNDLTFPYSYISALELDIREITSTVYDRPVFVTGLTQKNLLNRVSATYNFDTYEDFQNLNGRFTLYSYDELGNVQSLLQNVKTTEYAAIAPEIKRIDYLYDLVSGKVNRVRYQPGQPDQFTHIYEYDADNRITDVYTSRDGLIIHQEAKYYYYPHGSLSRIELGYNKVQGIDYYYTLQGWLKGINHPGLSGDKDGQLSWSRIPKDAVTLQLGYFDGDYKSISTDNGAVNIFNQYLNQFNQVDDQNTYGFYNTRGKGLYNGNIAMMATGMSVFDHPEFPDGKWKINNYQYDQLNRIKAMNSVGMYDPISSTPFANHVRSIQTSYIYDPNGNIERLNRTAWKENGTAPIDMDKLSYRYRANTNQLLYVNDEVSELEFDSDIDDQADNNYDYDRIGNLTKDESEDIEHIHWNAYGKIASIQYAPNTRNDLKFLYDATGNRVAKIQLFKDEEGEIDLNASVATWYIRDAQGNVLYTEVRRLEEDEVIVFNKEYSIYGSSRLGLYHEEDFSENTLPVDNHYYLEAGSREYELTNHLGNVLTTISDLKLYDDSEETYYAQILTGQDYYPFGMTIPMRTLKYVPCEDSKELRQIPGNGRVVYYNDFTLPLERRMSAPVTPSDPLEGWISESNVATTFNLFELGTTSWFENRYQPEQNSLKLTFQEGFEGDSNSVALLVNDFYLPSSGKYRIRFDLDFDYPFEGGIGVVYTDTLDYNFIEGFSNGSVDSVLLGFTSPIDTHNVIEFTTVQADSVSLFLMLVGDTVIRSILLDNFMIEKIEEEIVVDIAQDNYRYADQWKILNYDPAFEGDSEYISSLGYMALDTINGKIGAGYVLNDYGYYSGYLTRDYKVEAGKIYHLEYQLSGINGSNTLVYTKVFDYRDINTNRNPTQLFTGKFEQRNGTHTLIFQPVDSIVTVAWWAESSVPYDSVVYFNIERVELAEYTSLSVPDSVVIYQDEFNHNSYGGFSPMCGRFSIDSSLSQINIKSDTTYGCLSFMYRDTLPEIGYYQIELNWGSDYSPSISLTGGIGIYDSTGNYKNGATGKNIEHFGRHIMPFYANDKIIQLGLSNELVDTAYSYYIKNVVIKKIQMEDTYVGVPETDDFLTDNGQWRTSLLDSNYASANFKPFSPLYTSIGKAVLDTALHQLSGTYSLFDDLAGSMGAYMAGMSGRYVNAIVTDVPTVIGQSYVVDLDISQIRNALSGRMLDNFVVWQRQFYEMNAFADESVVSMVNLPDTGRFRTTFEAIDTITTIGFMSINLDGPGHSSSMILDSVNLSTFVRIITYDSTLIYASDFQSGMDGFQDHISTFGDVIQFGNAEWDPVQQGIKVSIVGVQEEEGIEYMGGVFRKMSVDHQQDIAVEVSFSSDIPDFGVMLVAVYNDMLANPFFVPIMDTGNVRVVIPAQTGDFYLGVLANHTDTGTYYVRDIKMYGLNNYESGPSEDLLQGQYPWRSSFKIQTPAGNISWSEDSTKMLLHPISFLELYKDNLDQIDIEEEYLPFLQNYKIGIASIPMKVEIGARYLFDFDIPGTNGFFTSGYGLLDPYMLSLNNNNIHSSGTLVSFEDTSSSTRKQFEWVATQDSIVFAYLAFKLDSTDVPFVFNHFRITNVDFTGDSDTIYQQKFDNEASISTWRNSFLQYAERVEYVMSVLSLDTTNGRMRVEMLHNPMDDTGDSFVYGNVGRVFNDLKVDKEYMLQFRIETDTLDKLEPLGVMLLKQNDFERGFLQSAVYASFEEMSVDDTFKAVFEAFDTSIVALVVVRIEGEGPAHYYLDDYVFSEYWTEELRYKREEGLGEVIACLAHDSIPDCNSGMGDWTNEFNLMAGLASIPFGKIGWQNVPAQNESGVLVLKPKALFGDDIEEPTYFAVAVKELDTLASGDYELFLNASSNIDTISPFILLTCTDSLGNFDLFSNDPFNSLAIPFNIENLSGSRKKLSFRLESPTALSLLALSVQPFHHIGYLDNAFLRKTDTLLIPDTSVVMNDDFAGGNTFWMPPAFDTVFTSNIPGYYVQQGWLDWNIAHERLGVKPRAQSEARNDTYNNNEIISSVFRDFNAEVGADYRINFYIQHPAPEDVEMSIAGVWRKNDMMKGNDAISNNEAISFLSQNGKVTIDFTASASQLAIGVLNQFRDGTDTSLVGMELDSVTIDQMEITRGSNVFMDTFDSLSGEYMHIIPEGEDTAFVKSWISLSGNSMRVDMVPDSTVDEAPSGYTGTVIRAMQLEPDTDYSLSAYVREFAENSILVLAILPDGNFENEPELKMVPIEQRTDFFFRTGTSGTTVFGVIMFNDTGGYYLIDTIVIQEVDIVKTRKVTNDFVHGIHGWRTSYLDVNDKAASVVEWRAAEGDLLLSSRKSYQSMYAAPLIRPIEVEPGVPHILSLRMKNLEDKDMSAHISLYNEPFYILQDLRYVVDNEGILEQTFSSFKDEVLTIAFTPTQSHMTLFVNAMADDDSFTQLSLDDVVLKKVSDYQYTTLWEESFDDESSTASWRNSVVPYTTAPTQFGIATYDPVENEVELELTPNPFGAPEEYIALVGRRFSDLEIGEEYTVQFELHEVNPGDIDGAQVVFITEENMEGFPMPTVGADIVPDNGFVSYTFTAPAREGYILVGAYHDAGSPGSAARLRNVSIHNARRIMNTCYADHPMYAERGYRFGFNGMEQDDEVKGRGNSLDFGARIYDSRLGRFLSIDPLYMKFPFETPYSFSLNSPIYFIDEDGQEPVSAAIEAITSFGISVGMDFFTGLLLERKSVGGALANVGWLSATGDAIVTFGASLAGAKGVGASRKVTKFVNSRLGKVTSKTIINMTTNLQRNIERGKYNNEKGELQKSKILNLNELKTLFLEAAFEALLEEGLSDAAIDLVKTLRVKNLPAHIAERYERLNKTNRAGQPFTVAGKENVIDINKHENFGTSKCRDCKVNTIPATQSQKGVTPDWRETNVDHVKSRDSGGSGTPNNGDVRCRGCNIEKSNN